MVAEYVKNVTLSKASFDTLTATAASVGVLSFLGIGLTNWVQILTCIWFLILIARWFVTDIWPMIRNLFRGKDNAA